VGEKPGVALWLTLGSSVVLAGKDAGTKILVLEYPATMVAWATYGVMTLAIGAASWRGLGPRLLQPTMPGMQLLRSAVAAFAVLCFYRSLLHLPLGESLAIAFLAPVFTALAAARWLRERVTVATWLALAGSIAGMLMIVRPGGALFGWTALYPLGTALGLSAYQLTTRVVAQVDDARVTMFFSSFVLFVLFSCAMPFTFTAPASGGDLGLLLLVGMLTAIGQMMLTFAYRYGTAAVVSALGYGGIVWGAVFGWLLFGHAPDAWAIAGMAVIAASGVLLVKPSR
jgi:drug/metabolite transporter (DMT)-like permease